MASAPSEPLLRAAHQGAAAVRPAFGGTRVRVRESNSGIAREQSMRAEHESSAREQCTRARAAPGASQPPAAETASAAAGAGAGAAGASRRRRRNPAAAAAEASDGRNAWRARYVRTGDAHGHDARPGPRWERSCGRLSGMTGTSSVSPGASSAVRRKGSDGLNTGRGGAVRRTRAEFERTITSDDPDRDQHSMLQGSIESTVQEGFESRPIQRTNRPNRRCSTPLVHRSPPLATVYAIGNCAHNWQLCMSLATVHVIGNCVCHWQLCMPLATVHVIGNCVCHWQLCMPLATVYAIGNCVCHWQLCVRASLVCASGAAGLLSQLV
jgi:hypothetical protein